MHTNKRRPNNMNGGGGGGQHRHNNNRPRRFNNNRPQEGGGDPASVSRTRRMATQSREKYQMMARDAMSMGDRVLAENWLQHADHYHRILLALPPEEQQRQHPRPYQQGVQGQGENGNVEGGNAEGGNGEAGHDMQNAQSSEGNHSHSADPMSQGHSGHALPSFITQQQTMHSETPEGGE